MTTRRHVRPRTILAIAAAILMAGAAAARAATPGEVLWKHTIVRSPASGKIERFWVGHAAGLKPDGTYPAVYFLDGLLGDEHEWKNALQPLLGEHELVAVCPSVGGATYPMAPV